jgi:hypothetical protein
MFTSFGVVGDHAPFDVNIKLYVHIHIDDTELNYHLHHVEECTHVLLLLPDYDLSTCNVHKSI